MILLIPACRQVLLITHLQAGFLIEQFAGRFYIRPDWRQVTDSKLLAFRQVPVWTCLQAGFINDMFAGWYNRPAYKQVLYKTRLQGGLRHTNTCCRQVLGLTCLHAGFINFMSS